MSAFDVGHKKEHVMRVEKRGCPATLLSAEDEILPCQN